MTDNLSEFNKGEILNENKRDKRLDNALLTTYEGDTLLSCVYIEHNSLPELSIDQIDTSMTFFGKDIPFPIMINAMTGGTEQGVEINEALYNISKELGIPMEVGSQDVLMEDTDVAELFLGEIVEDEERKTVLLSNLNANSTVEEIKFAMDTIKADGIALHINAGQEIFSKDGITDFNGRYERIKNAAKIYSDRLIVKEVGSGMSKDTIKKLVDAGVKNIDISGSGGTNFIEIENLRNFDYDFSDLYEWGIPTAKSIINARSISQDINIIASGGIKTALDIVRALILGADIVGVSGEVLKYLIHGGYDYAKEYLTELMHKTKIVMLLLGAKNIDELKTVPYKITGKLKDII